MNCPTQVKNPLKETPLQGGCCSPSYTLYDHTTSLINTIMNKANRNLVNQAGIFIQLNFSNNDFT
jgi:hypothetical protein